MEAGKKLPAFFCVWHHCIRYFIEETVAKASLELIRRDVSRNHQSSQKQLKGGTATPPQTVLKLSNDLLQNQKDKLRGAEKSQKKAARLRGG